MKKIGTIVAATLIGASAFVTGCDQDEAVLRTAANTAGNLAISAWFAVDDPDAQVKDGLRLVVDMTVDASSKIGDGESYVTALTPLVQSVIAEHAELNSAQKNLINVGSSVVLGALDVFISSHPKLRGNAALVSTCVAEFGKGCLTAIGRSEGDPASRAIKSAHATAQLKFDARVKAFVHK